MTYVAEHTARLTVASGDVTLAARQSGDPDAPTIVLLHGFPDTQALWSLIVARLSDRFHVVTYDIRGAGASTAPTSQADYTLDHLAYDARAVFDAIAPEKRVHLVGHDWGAIQGWEFLYHEQTADRIASFTSMCGASLDHTGLLLRRRLTHPTPAGLLGTADQLARSWYMLLSRLPAGAAATAWRQLAAPAWATALSYLEGVDTNGGFPAPTLPDDGARLVALYRENALQRVLRPRRRPPVQTPVLIVRPTGDPFLAQRTLADAERHAPNLTRRTIAGGHWVPRTQPELLARWIGEHADAVERGETPRQARRKPPSAKRPLHGRLALVTGAASGIGRETARRFAAAGAEVVLVDVDLAGARSLQRELTASSAVAHAQRADVSDPAAWDELGEAIAARHGTIDVLVNNAGIAVAGPFLATTTEDWERLLGVNLWGVIHGCRVFGAQMVARGEGGHIVNIASAAAFQPSKALAAYSTSKAAVAMLSQSLRAEFAGYDIGVSAICPGIVATNILNAATFAGRDPDQQEQARRRLTALYRLRNYGPEQVADEVLRAVLQNRAIVPVTPEAKAVYALSRISPGALRTLAKLDPVPG